MVSHRRIIPVIIAIILTLATFAAAPSTFAQNYSACGTLVQGLDCMFFQPFSGGQFLLQNYGGFQPGDTVKVVGTYNLATLCWCVTFQYHCITPNTITKGCPTPQHCCIGVTGDVNSSGSVDLSDLSVLVSYLTGGLPLVTCIGEGDVDASGVINLSDLSALVNYLTGGSFVLPPCRSGT